MVRLALATILVLAALALVSTVFAGWLALRRESGGYGGEATIGGTVLQKVAFILLVMLILYVSATGGA